jgi:large subunit ribosomal protein L21
MYAVIQTGGKQYRVAPGDLLQVEKLPGDIGNALTFDQVLLLKPSKEEASHLEMGKPFIQGASVSAQVVGQGRGKKILIVKMKRRKQYRRTQGHRQEQTHLLITGWNAPTGSFELSAEEKSAILSKVQSPLKPKMES